ncbi:lipo-like protein [Hansschlegelia sp. KR7-227]|uniref:lipo-like protein n=1 Tax=Hansschlegelia sp. KR7-227 TaxID=3400914 RepID=UPI003C0BE1BC
MDWLGSAVGRRAIAYLTAEVRREPLAPGDPKALAATLRVGDVILVAGRSRVAGVIRRMTSSIWSHAALYVGDMLDAFEPDGERHTLVEMELGIGCASAPLSKYASEQTRVCRPFDLDLAEREQVARYCILRIGYEYDVKNVFDLMRYLAPLPLLSPRCGRRVLMLGSGLPTRAICSSLIARAFEQVRYPILPRVETVADAETRKEILHIRHHSLYMPRDFDISPFFEVVKPTLAQGFDYRRLVWAERRQTARSEASHPPSPALVAMRRER